MSKTVVIRYEMRPDTADENQKLVENVFAELAEKTPEGLRYTAFRLADGVTFVHVAVLPDEGNPLGDTEAFQEFQRDFGARVAGPPVGLEATVVGSYGFTSD